MGISQTIIQNTGITPLAYTLVSFAIIIIIHELGHYTAFLHYKIRPKFRIVWGNILLGEDAMYLLTSKQAIIVANAGILAGLIPTLLLVKPLTLIYLLMCALDLLVIFQMTQVREWNTPLHQSIPKHNRLLEKEIQQKIKTVKTWD